jgi:hypothetical protein
MHAAHHSVGPDNGIFAKLYAIDDHSSMADPAVVANGDSSKAVSLGPDRLILPRGHMVTGVEASVRLDQGPSPNPKIAVRLKNDIASNIA